MLGVFIYLIIHWANTANAELENQIDVDVIKTEHYVIWPNGVVPFYIEPEHFDHEQSLAIMTALSLFAFRTCLKFNPVLVRPTNTQHVLVFENPNGVRKCVFNTEGHLPDGPHKVTLGYGCMTSPQIDMMVMRALGFSFEHNRASRDLFIDVQFENIDPSAVELFTKESKLPPELRPLRYDVNSVTHFGERDFSKNGHRTIIFKDHTVKQNRIGLSELDLRKIEIVYGPECLTRERQEKIELCQNYPGVARRRRDIPVPVNVTNLRVNREITPPPEILEKASEKPQQVTEEVTKVTTVADQPNHLNQLGIESDAKEIMDKMNNLSSTVFQKTRSKYCNDTGKHLRSGDNANKLPDLLGTIDLLSRYARSIVDHADEDPESFCTSPDTVDKYIARCGYDNNRCKQFFKSTQSRYRWSTQQKSPNHWHTKHPSRGNLYDPIWKRSGNASNVEETKVRKKRETAKTNTTEPKKDDKKFEVKKAEIKVDKETKTETPTTSKAVVVNAKNTTTTSVTNKTVTSGRRRFRDSPFSVYRRKKDEKEGAYASDVSLEAKQKKRFKKIKSQGKHRKTHKKEKRVHQRAETQTSHGRIKREVTPSTITVNGNKVILNTAAIAEDTKNSRTDIKPDQGASKLPTSTPPKTEKKRRFNENPFSVLKQKDGKNYASDVSLEIKPTKKELKKSKKLKKKLQKLKNNYKNERAARKKRDVKPILSSVLPEVKSDKPKSSVKPPALHVKPPVLHVNQADHNISMRIANETLIHGIRRFRDSPFSVYKLKKNEKKYLYASDLSLEIRPEKKYRKFNPKKKRTLKTKTNENGAKPRGDAESYKIRGKREIELEGSSFEDIEDGEETVVIDDLADDAKHEISIPIDNSGDIELSNIRKKRDTELDRSSVEIREDREEKRVTEKPEVVEEEKVTEAATEVPKRRFKVVPFSPDNMNYEKDGYPSDLSLERKTEVVVRGPKYPKTQPSHGKKKRSKSRQPFDDQKENGLENTMSMETKQESAEKPVRKPVYKIVKLTKKNEEFYADRKWPDGVVRYMIKDIPKYDVDDVRFRLEEVNKILKEKTCVYLLEITKEDRSLFEDYLVLDNSPDYVTGRVGGKQHFGVTELFAGSQHRQHAAMVVMSMLGFYFEPSRHDRDRFIRVHPRHIRADKLHHFEPLRPDATLPLPYDYKSATHPPWQFWRHFGKTGISSLATYKDQDPDGSIMKSLGHHSKLLSDLDIVKINSVYGVRCFREKEKRERTI